MFIVECRGSPALLREQEGHFGVSNIYYANMRCRWKIRVATTEVRMYYECTTNEYLLYLYYNDPNIDVTVTKKQTIF